MIGLSLNQKQLNVYERMFHVQHLNQKLLHGNLHQ